MLQIDSSPFQATIQTNLFGLNYKMQVVFSNLIVVVFIVEKIYVYKKSVASIRDYQLFRYTASSYIQGDRSLSSLTTRER